MAVLTNGWCLLPSLPAGAAELSSVGEAQSSAGVASDAGVPHALLSRLQLNDVSLMILPARNNRAVTSLFVYSGSVSHCRLKAQGPR